MDQVNLLLDAFMATAISIGGGGGKKLHGNVLTASRVVRKRPPARVVWMIWRMPKKVAPTLEALLGIDELVDKIMGFVGLVTIPQVRCSTICPP